MTHTLDSKPIDLDTPQSIHVLNIGGKAMSAIAEILQAMGHTVSGSDPKDVSVLHRLRALGIAIEVGENYTLDSAVQTVVCSTATQATHPILVEAQRRGLPVYQRPEFQGAIAQTRRTLAVSGTHGKTTTTAMLVHILRTTGLNPSYIVGGDIDGAVGGVAWNDGDWFIVEADESDGTFLKLGAEVVVVTNIDADHLDFWGSTDAIEEAFGRFVATAERSVISFDNPRAAKLAVKHGASTFGVNPDADLVISNVRVDRTKCFFDLTQNDVTVAVELPEPGVHNATNAAAAIQAAQLLGVSLKEAARSLASFGGVARRFEIRGEIRGVTFVDDYAHNPVKVQALLDSAAAAGWNRVVAVFQPHRYSRTQTQGHEFADSFRGADLLVITDIDPAGEAPRPGVTKEVVIEAVKQNHPETEIVSVTDEELVATVAGLLSKGDLCITIGAGTITSIPDLLIAAMNKRDL